MKKFLIALSVVFLLCVGSIYLFLHNLDLESIQAQVLARLNERLAPARVEADPLRIMGMSGLGLNNVRLFIDEREAFRAETIELKLELASLFDSQVRFSKALLSDSRLSLWRRGDVWNLQAIGVDATPNTTSASLSDSPRDLSLEAADPNQVQVLVDAFSVETLQVMVAEYSSQKPMATLNAEGRVSLPEISVTEGELLHGQSSVVPFNLDWNVETQAGALQVHDGSLRIDEMLPEQMSLQLEPLQVSVNGRALIEEEEPEFAFKVNSDGFSMPMDMGQVQPFELSLGSDAVTGVVQIQDPRFESELDVQIASPLGQRDLSGTSLKVKSGLQNFSAQAQGKMGAEVRLSGTVAQPEFAGKVFGSEIQMGFLSVMLQPALAFQGRIYEQYQRLEIARAKGYLKPDAGLVELVADIPLASELLPILNGIDLHISDIPASWLHPDLKTLRLDTASFSRSKLAFEASGLADTSVRMRASMDPKLPLWLSDMQLVSQWNLSEFTSLMNQLELPHAQGLLKVGGKLVEGDELQFSLASERLSLILTDQMNPVVFTETQAGLQIKPLERAFRLASLKSQVFGGNLSAEGNLASVGETLANQFQAQLDGIDLRELAAVVDQDLKKHFEGTLDADIPMLKLVQPLGEPRPIAMQGTFQTRDLVYYWHQTVADMIDGIENSIRQKFLGNILKREEKRARTDVRYTAFQDMQPAQFELLRSRLQLNDVQIVEQERDFEAATDELVLHLPMEEPRVQEGTVRGLLRLQASNAFLKEKIPMLRDDYTAPMVVQVPLDGPFSLPLPPDEQSRIQRETTAGLVRQIDPMKAKDMAKSAVEGVKSFFRGSDDSKAGAQKQVENKVEREIDRSLDSVEKHIGSTATQKIKDKIQEKIGEKLFKLF